MDKQKMIGHIISHTHWDREWRVPQWHSRHRLIVMMDKLLNKLEKQPEFIFLFDGQVIGIEDYIDICPQQKERVKRFISNGQLQIGPWYNLPDLYPVCGEALVRNLLKGKKAANDLGKCFDIAYTTFGWGQTAQLPQIYKSFGMNRIVCAKNVSKERAPNSEFIWESPDGTRVLTTRLGVEKRANFFFYALMPAMYGFDYGDDNIKVKWGQNGWMWHNVDTDFDSEITFLKDNKYHSEIVKQSVEAAWDTTKETLVPEHVFLGNGCDSTAPSDFVDQIIDTANKIFPDRKFKYSDLSSYFDGLEQTICDKNIQLKTVYGELRDGPAHALAGNALATRMPLKSLNRKAQNALIRYGEAFAALATLVGAEFPSMFIDRAWNYLLLAHSHDALNGVTLDKTSNDTAYKLNQVIELSGLLMDIAAINLLKKVDLKAYFQEDILLGIFNPTAHECRQIVRIAVDVPTEDSPRRLSAIDTDGGSLAVQPIAHFSHQAPVCVENSRALPYYADRHFAYLDTGKIPAYGYKIVKAVPVDQYKKNLLFWHPTYEYGSQLCGPNKMANRYLDVEIHPDGTFTLNSKVTGQEFPKCGFYEDSGDVGDYWQRVRPEYDKVYHSTSFPANIYIKEDGPLVTAFVCEQTLKLPAFAEKMGGFNNSRSGELADVKICTELKLKANSPFLEVEVTVTNDVRDHRLRVGIPTFITAEASAAMGHFNVDNRPIVRKYENGIRDGEMGTMPMQHFVDISDGSKGVAILSDSLSEFEVSEDTSRTVYLTLLRCMAIKISTEGRCATVDDNTVGSQCPGKHTFKYAIFLHKGNWLDADVYGAMEQFIFTPKVYQISRHDEGHLPQALSLFTIDNKNIQISAIKKSEDGSGIIIRMYNPTESSQMCNVKIAGQVKHAWVANMNEEKQENLRYENGAAVVLAKCEIKTLLFCVCPD